VDLLTLLQLVLSS